MSFSFQVGHNPESLARISLQTLDAAERQQKKILLRLIPDCINVFYSVAISQTDYFIHFQYSE